MPRKTTPDADVSEGEGDSPTVARWHARAVERSLERSRAAAEKRSADFVQTALKLVNKRGGQDFTVQDLVTAMRISTRTFYQYFRSKEELLVAMFEEVQRQHNRELRAAAGDVGDPLARLEGFVLGLLRRAQDERDFTVGRLLIAQFLQLQVSHPDELQHSYTGLLNYLTELVAEAAEAGEIDSSDHRRTAALIMQTVVSATQAMVIGSPVIDPAPTPEEVWSFCLKGIGAHDAVKAAPRKRAPRR
jgi:TetR/AcrR family transcriptional regulator